MQRKKIPPGILAQDEMGKIMFDLAASEEFVISFLMKDSVLNRDSMLGVEADKVLKIHRVDQDQFRKSYEFYKSRPDFFKVTMDSLYNRVQRQRELLYRPRIVK